MSLHADVMQMKKMLANLDLWIEKAIAHAESKKFDANVLAGARLAPDMYSFSRQVQSACDAAKFVAARLTGSQAPAHPDTETTMTELRERCAKTIAFLDAIPAASFDGSDTREVVVPYLPGLYCLGADYMREQAAPNFYFHVTTAYAILRHNGVDLGKRDLFGALTLHPAK